MIMPMITALDLIDTITASFRTPIPRAVDDEHRVERGRSYGHSQRGNNQRREHRPWGRNEYGDQSRRGFFAPRQREEAAQALNISDTLPLISEGLKNIVTPLIHEDRPLRAAEKESLVEYLKEQWQAIQIQNPQQYFKSSEQNPYKLNIALAKLLFTDNHIKTLYHTNGELHASFHTLLIPTALNSRTSSWDPFENNLQNLYYLNEHLVTSEEILATLKVHKIFANPYNNEHLLAAVIIGELCQHLTYRAMIASTVFPVICGAHGIDHETCQALGMSDLKQLMMTGDYPLLDTTSLEPLRQALLPACHSAGAVENLQQGIEAFHIFKTSLYQNPHADRILSLRNYATHKTIQVMMTDIATTDTCLSENASNICTILLSTIQVLQIFRTDFNADINQFPDYPIGIPEPQINEDEAQRAMAAVGGGDSTDNDDTTDDEDDDDINFGTASGGLKQH